MKSTNCCRLSLLTLLLLAVAASTALAGSEWVREFDARTGQRLQLDLPDGGSLEVEGWDQDRVRIACEAVLNDIDDYEITAEETSYGLRLRATLGSRGIQRTNLVVRVRVPREFDVETSSVGGGISIADVKGEFRGRTAGGPITLTRVAGVAHLKTGGGRIEILDSDLDGEVHTGGGGALVNNVVGEVRATAGGGVVSYRNVRDREGRARGPAGRLADGFTDGTIVYTSAGGGIELDEAPEGAQVETGGGDIDIRRAARFVQAHTGGGSIDIEITDGYVVATTGAGDIEIVVREGLGGGPEGLDLSTGLGEVTVILPADASLELDLDLAYTRNSSQDYEIDSDFDLAIERTRDWDTRHGTPRKHLLGTGTINGGRHKVAIRTTNGDIRLLKR